MLNTYQLWDKQLGQTMCLGKNAVFGRNRLIIVVNR